MAAAAGGHPRSTPHLQPRRRLHRSATQRQVPRHRADHPVPLPAAAVPVRGDGPDRAASSRGPAPRSSPASCPGAQPDGRRSSTCTAGSSSHEPLDIDQRRRARSIISCGLLWFGFRFFRAAEWTVRTVMTAPLSISVRDLHLEYEIYENRRAALRDRLVNRQGTGRSVVHALKGVSFDVRQRRVRRRHRIQRLGQVDAAGRDRRAAAAHRRARSSCPTNPSCSASGATLMPDRHRLAQHLHRLPGARHEQRRARRAHRGDRRVHRPRRGAGPAAAHLLVRHEGAPALLHRHLGRPEDPAHRRGAGRRRPGASGRSRPTGSGRCSTTPGRCCSSATRSTTITEQCDARRCGSSRASCGPTVRSTR